MYVHSYSYLLNKLELGGYTYLQLELYEYCGTIVVLDVAQTPF